ncbi:hypothetical protein IWQ60_012608 [Tieghemiomyces parasiticus]|uniref:Uncharacterized protein n=1 Tax=Tieghemiomyces parasiticus TaxID=78921 RepID=A0A9W7ZLG8_9FUNG|nr:hypothetical protein IWQ60_012608 [Tieghemiomyces parasiticus]
MLHGASMAEAVRLMNMGGLHGVDPRMLAQQAMFHANTIYSNPSMYMGGMGGGYGMGVGYGMGHAY